MTYTFAKIEEQQIQEYYSVYTWAAQSHRFFITEQYGQPRRIRMGSIKLLFGGRVIILASRRVPFMLRRAAEQFAGGEGSENECYTRIGVAYVDGNMDKIIGGEEIDRQ